MTLSQQLHFSATHKRGYDPACPKCQVERHYGRVLSTEEKALLLVMAQKIKDAERDLGTLTAGQRRDLLQDNFSQIRDCEHAGYVVAMLEDGGLIGPATEVSKL